MQNTRRAVVDKRWLAGMGLLLVLGLVWLSRARDADTPRIFGARRELREQTTVLAGALSAAPPEAQASFTGTVRDTAGMPVANAEVCTACSRCDGADLPPLACTRTDDSGAYALSSLRCSAVSIFASAEGFEPASANAGQSVVCRPQGQSSLDIVLERIS